MQPPPVFGHEQIVTELIRGVLDVVADKPHLSPDRQAALRQTVVCSLMSYNPRDPIEVMLAGQCIVYDAVLRDGARDLLRGQAELIKLRARPSILAAGKMFLATTELAVRLRGRAADELAHARPLRAPDPPVEAPVAPVPDPGEPVAPLSDPSEPAVVAAQTMDAMPAVPAPGETSAAPGPVPATAPAHAMVAPLAAPPLAAPPLAAPPLAAPPLAAPPPAAPPPAAPPADLTGHPPRPTARPASPPTAPSAAIPAAGVPVPDQPAAATAAAQPRLLSETVDDRLLEGMSPDEKHEIREAVALAARLAAQAPPFVTEHRRSGRT